MLKAPARLSSNKLRLTSSAHSHSQTKIRSSSRKKTFSLSSTSSAAKSRHQASMSGLSRKSTYFQSPQSSKNAGCPSSRHRGAGSCFARNWEKCRSERVNLWRLQGRESRRTSATNSLKSSNPASLSMILSLTQQIKANKWQIKSQKMSAALQSSPRAVSIWPACSATLTNSYKMANRAQRASNPLRKIWKKAKKASKHWLMSSKSNKTNRYSRIELRDSLTPACPTSVKEQGLAAPLSGLTASFRPLSMALRGLGRKNSQT